MACHSHVRGQDALLICRQLGDFKKERDIMDNISAQYFALERFDEAVAVLQSQLDRAEELRLSEADAARVHDRKELLLMMQLYHDGHLDPHDEEGAAEAAALAAKAARV
eukprot:PLAT3144.1.p1 GENE.PLAT3144.1~~PLAT3144.1.p1  ORF type:complete len:109 (-),score=39.76 PLAT3144.1:54-380(-)